MTPDELERAEALIRREIPVPRLYVPVDRLLAAATRARISPEALYEAGRVVGVVEEEDLGGLVWSLSADPTALLEATS